ncbi:MAG: DUF423 domain-containing protein [Sandaracinaceae bacterium]
MRRWVIVLAGLSGILAVGLGAFGAHGLERMLEGAVDAEKRLGWWQTAVSYHLPHTVALFATGVLGARSPTRGTIVAASAFTLGMLLFSGSLYVMTLGAPRWFGAVTPLGGLSLMVGWGAITAVGARRLASGD